MKTTTIIATFFLPTLLAAEPLASGEWVLAAGTEKSIEELRSVLFVQNEAGVWSVSLSMHGINYSVPLTVTKHPRDNGREIVTGCATEAWTTRTNQGVSTILFRAAFDANGPTNGFLHMFTEGGLPYADPDKPHTLAVRLRPLNEIPNAAAVESTEAEQE